MASPDAPNAPRPAHIHGGSDTSYPDLEAGNKKSRRTSSYRLPPKWEKFWDRFGQFIWVLIVAAVTAGLIIGICKAVGAI
jgi:hypothetical protein